MSDNDRLVYQQSAVWVLLAFVGAKPSPDHQAAHWDGDPLNNRLSNLRWATPKENGLDTARHGTLKGEGNAAAKLTEQQVIELRKSYALGAMTVAELARRFNCPDGAVRLALKGQTWTHLYGELQ